MFGQKEKANARDERPPYVSPFAVLSTFRRTGEPANYVSPAGPPQTGNETTRVSIRTMYYTGVRVNTYTRSPWSARVLARLKRSGWKYSRIKPGAGGSDIPRAGDNLRLYIHRRTAV